VKCPEARESLAAYVGAPEANLALHRHLAECAECSAEHVRYRRLLDSLAELGSSPLAPPTDLYDALLAVPGEAALARVLRRRADVMTGHVVRNRGAYLGGAGVALAGAMGAAVWRVRSRRVATA
jgi:anti-sigma factor RsiW